MLLSMRVRILLLALFPVVVPCQTPRTIEAALIRNIDPAKQRVSVQSCDPNCNGDVKAYSAADVFGPLLKDFHDGDRVSLNLDQNDLVTSMRILEVPVGAGLECAVVAGAFGFCLLIAALLTRGHILQLILGEDNRYSNSKTQLAIWFTVLIATYIATVCLRAAEAGWDFLDGIQIPEHLALISGMSVLTFGGAKAITTSKIDAAFAAGDDNPKPTMPQGRASLLRDLVKSDVQRFDLGDFQMLIVTFVAVGMYLAGILYFLSSIPMSKSIRLPDVDTTILATFGLGQGAYLTKKAVGNPGTS